ncbi:MAG: hypothetical protein UD936_02165 [Acutalibacteraceae bacterium]|nr:hypothetical protein [Acutalibacteraceae bacterium]
MGTVVALTQSNDEYILKINFDNGEEKMLYSSYCGMRLVEE